MNGLFAPLAAMVQMIMVLLVMRMVMMLMPRLAVVIAGGKYVLEREYLDTDRVRYRVAAYYPGRAVYYAVVCNYGSVVVVPAAGSGSIISAGEAYVTYARDKVDDVVEIDAGSDVAVVTVEVGYCIDDRCENRVAVKSDSVNLSAPWYYTPPPGYGVPMPITPQPVE